MRFPDGCMGVQPSEAGRPCGIGCDIRYGSYDLAICDVIRPEPGMVLPRLVFYGKVEDEQQALFIQDQYGGRASVIDSRPDATVASRYQKECKARGIKCWRAQYSPAPTNRKITVDDKEGLITLDRLQVLDDVMFAVSGGIGIALPQNFREICSGSFVSEMCNSNREPVVWHGIPTFTWKNSSDDHAMHAISYMLLAVALGRLDSGSSEALMPQKGIVSSSLSEMIDDDDDESDMRHWRRAGVVHQA